MPDIERRILTPWGVLSATAFSGLVAGAAYLGGVPVAVVVAIASAATAYGWPRLLDLPSRGGVRVVLGLATVMSVGSSLVGDGPDLRWLPVGLAATLVASFLHQLLRRDGRARLVGTLGGTLLGAGLIAAGVCFVAASGQEDGPLLVLAAALAVASSTALDWVMHRGERAEWALPLATGVASAAAAAVAVATGGPVAGAFLVAVVACVVSHAVRRLLTVVATAASSRAQVALGATALLSTGPVPYAGAWLIEWFATR